MSVKREILFRVGIVYVLFVGIGLAIVGKIMYIQFVEGSKWRAMAKNITYKDITIEPNRGDIRATDGRLLSTSVPYYEIRMDLLAAGLTDEVFYREIDSLSIALARFFGDKSRYTYRSELINARKYARNRRYYPVSPRQVNYLEMKEIREFPLLRLGANRGGFIPVQVNRRIRPHSSLAARTIGVVNEGGVAVGLEGAFDHILRGKAGVSLQQRVPGNMWVEVNSSSHVSPQDGMDIISTIDVTLQDVAEQTLRTQLYLHDASHGTVVLMEVQTGEVRAIANLKRNSNGTYSEAFNYAIGESAEPGSTFKIASLIALLEDGHVRLTDTVDCMDGNVQYYDKTVIDSREGGWGRISVREVFEYSSNVGVTEMVTKYYHRNERRFIDRIYAMNLNQPLGIPIAGEANPYIKYPGDNLWSGVSLPMMSIGYELTLTPLQILSFFNAIANNGRMVRPKFVKEIQQHGRTERVFRTEVINPSICSRSTLAKVREVLEGVVENGTAKNLANKNYKIAGKTGTAQIAQGSMGYHGEKGPNYQASFVGYFPADNPKYSCIVIVNSPSRSVFYGNVVAGPIFKEIADKVYATSPEWFGVIARRPELAELPESKGGYAPELEKVFNSLRIPSSNNLAETRWASTRRNDNSVDLIGRDIVQNLVPDVTGMPLKDAIYLLENEGLRVETRGRGTVRSQSVAPGTRPQRGGRVTLEMSMN